MHTRPQPLAGRPGVSALATTASGDGELVLSNTGTSDTAVSFEVLSFDGVVLQTEDVLLAPDSSATRRLTSPPPSYVVVRVPDGSAVVGGVVLTQAEGNVAGLATTAGPVGLDVTTRGIVLNADVTVVTANGFARFNPVAEGVTLATLHAAG